MSAWDVKVEVGELVLEGYDDTSLAPLQWAVERAVERVALRCASRGRSLLVPPIELELEPDLPQALVVERIVEALLGAARIEEGDTDT